MEFDPVGSAQSIPHMIENDTLMEVLDEDQLSECLKHITLNVDDSLYILDKIETNYNDHDRIRTVRNIFTDFDSGNKFDSKKFVEFIRALGRCLQVEILESVASIINSVFSKIDQLFFGIEQTKRKTPTKFFKQAQNISMPRKQNTPDSYNASMYRLEHHEKSKHIILGPLKQKRKVNKNIEELKQVSQTEDNFNKIYKICERIATEKDSDAMTFAIREKFVYVTENGKDNYKNIFTKAAYDNNQDLVRFLIESKIDINSRDKYNSTALIWASEEGNYEVVKILLSVPGIDVNAKDKHGWTALISSSHYGHQDVVKLILAVPGIKVNAKDNNNYSPLMYASLFGHLETVKLLLSVPGICVNEKSRYNETALILASRNGHPEIAELLKDHGAI